jgi:vacuolar-type H+-ATPase subunit D/Vma8
VEENLKKYKQILNIAEYSESIASTGGSLTRDSYNRERLLKLDQFRVERDAIKKEIKRLDENIKNNKKSIELIDDMKLVIRMDSGEEICVTRDMVVGATDSIDLLQAKKKLLIPRLERILKEIETLELEIKKKNNNYLCFLLNHWLMSLTVR